MTFNMKKFNKLTQLSATRAVDSLTKMTGLDTNISIMNVHIDDTPYDFKDLSSDAYVATIQLPIRGDVTGL